MAYKEYPFTRAMKDLSNASISWKLTTWQEVKTYAERFDKYNNLTLRQIDEVFKLVKKINKTLGRK